MRFTIRDLLWFTLVIALGVAWSLDRRHTALLAAERERLWRETAVKMIIELSTTTGSNVTFTTPDGELISLPPPVRLRDTVLKTPTPD